MTIAESALAYRGAGLSVLPACLAEKRPALPAWKTFQSSLPSERQVQTWCEGAEALCIVTGAVSGNVEMIDFDGQGALFEAWCERVRTEDAALSDRLVVEKSPSGGLHVAYRHDGPVSGNLKLAQRRVVVSGPDPVELLGKRYMPRKDGEAQWSAIVTLIETRGERGLFLCAPSPGYVLMQGDFIRLPMLSGREREVLLEAAWSLNEHWPEVAGPDPTSVPNGHRPGDEFNARGDVRAVLMRHGWTLAKPGENEYWRRPGKDHGWSATLKERVFYVFSSSAAPFEPDRAYSPFAVYALLEHGGDYALAATALRAEGYGQESPGVHLSAEPCEDKAPDVPDPGPLADELLQVPGFIAEVMDYTLATAPYPNPVMAFSGALALQATLAGRKVRDPGNNRTNLYLLGLAHSAAGKDRPRQVNTEILHAIGLSSQLGGRFASGEGIQDALFTEPCMLFQTDEIDGMLQSINKSKDARHENIMGTLLTLYSSAASVFPMRRKAGKDSPGSIDQPCLVLFGTAIPTHYYEALSERMLTNGFFARMLILECAKRAPGQKPRILPLPPRVLETASWWGDFRPGKGNLQNWHPDPPIVPHTPEAEKLLEETLKEADAEYGKAEEVPDSVGMTVWGRVSEQTRKLALLYAVSEDHEHPEIGVAAVEWARAFVLHQTRRMLFMAAGHVAQNPFHAECLRIIRKLRKAPSRTLPHSVLLKRLNIDARNFGEIIGTLEQRGDLIVKTEATAGRPLRCYQLAAGR